MNRIRHIRRDASNGWASDEVDDRRIITSSGDIILDVQDLWNPQELLQQRVLWRWAAGWSFSLDGIGESQALLTLLEEGVLGSLDDLPDQQFASNVRSAFLGNFDHENLPAYRVRIDGGLVRHMLVDIFDGPFESFDDLVSAARRRSIPADARSAA